MEDVGGHTVGDLDAGFKAAQQAIQSQVRLLDGILETIPEEFQEWRNKFNEVKKELNKAANSGESMRLFEMIPEVLQLIDSYGKSVSTES